MSMLQVNSLPGRGVFKSADYYNILPGTTQNLERPDSIVFKSGVAISPKSSGETNIMVVGEIKEGFLCGTTITGFVATKPGSMLQKINENGDTEIQVSGFSGAPIFSHKIIDGQKGVKGYVGVLRYEKNGRWVGGVDEKQVPVTCLPGGEYKIDKYLINPFLKTSEFRLKTEEEPVK